MKMQTVILSLCLCGAGEGVWGEVAPATATPASPQAPAAPSAAMTGETVTEPTPEAMTDSSKEGVFVTLTRAAYSSQRLPTSAEILANDTFEKFHAQNAGEAISRATSIQTLPTGQLESFLTAHIRGSTANQTLILMDGRPMSGVGLAVPDLTEISTEGIDRIEILRGGASALYGPNALGGVINIISKRAAYHGLPVSHIGFEVGSFDRQAWRLDFGSRYKSLDYFFFGDEQREGAFRKNSDARTHTLGGNIGWSLGRAGKLLLDISSYRRNAGMPGYDHTTPLVPNQFNNQDEKESTTPTARTLTNSNYLRTSYLLPLPANSLMTLRLFGSEHEADTTIPEYGSHIDTHAQSHGGEAQFSLPWGFMIGGNFVHDREDNTDKITSANSFIQRVENWGVFAQDTLTWKFLTLIPSGRYDHNSRFGDTSNPRVQVVAEATPYLRFSGSAARSFRAPSIDELTPVPGGFLPFLGGPNLRPETAWTYDSGFEIHQASYSFKATYFRANVTNLIQTVSTDPSDFFALWEAINVGKARREGFEIDLDYTLNEVLRNRVNYTYLENRGVLPGSPEMVTLQYSPRHTVNDVLTVTPHKNWQIDFTGRYLDSRWSGNNRTGTKLGSQYIQDIRISCQMRQMELYFGSNDLFNKRYEEQPGFPLPGRTYFGGIRLRLWG